MKNFRFVLTILATALVPLLMGSSCGNNYPTGGGMYGGGGTPMPTSTPGPRAAVTIMAMSTGAYTYAYSPSTVTITHGQSVQWSLSSIHPLNIDDGSGTCLVSGTTMFPYTYTFMTAGTYHFHCGVHSTCGNGMCPNPSTCTGMVGTVTVN